MIPMDYVTSITWEMLDFPASSVIVGVGLELPSNSQMSTEFAPVGNVPNAVPEPYVPEFSPYKTV